MITTHRRCIATSRRKLTPSVMKLLEGFHVRGVRSMAGALPTIHENGRDWMYPSSANILKKVGLQTIAEYI